MTLQDNIFLISSQFMRHPLVEVYHLSNLLQIPNDYRMVGIEFFSNFFRSCKRISFDDGSQLVFINFWWPATIRFILKAHISFAELLEPPLHSMFVSSSGPNVLVLQVVSAALQPILNSNKKIMEKEMATHSSILAWKSPWTEEPGGLQSMGLHEWACVQMGGGRVVNKVVELKKRKKEKKITWICFLSNIISIA